MRLHHLRLAAVALPLLSHAPVHAQANIVSAALLHDVLERSGISDTNAPEHEAAAAATQDDRKRRGQVAQTPLYEWWKHPGVSVSVGVNGFGVDVAEAVRQRVNIRIGAELFQYVGDFTAEGANVHADVRLGGGHAGIEIFPFEHSSFHVSPQLRFGILTRAKASVIVPPGQSIDFNSRTYYSAAPPSSLQGNAYVDTSKVAPGISFGFGNLVPRERYQHWSFPVDLGFYYIGQPNFKTFFTGSECADQALTICYDVNLDPDSSFPADKAKFDARERHNLSYASLFPILSFGVGYRF